MAKIKGKQGRHATYRLFDGSDFWLDSHLETDEKLPHDLAAYGAGNGWKSVMPMQNIIDAFRKYQRKDEATRKVIGEGANEITQAARIEDADEGHLIPYRLHGYCLEHDVETLGDALEAQLDHCHCIPHLRLASRFASNMFNVFGMVTLTSRPRPIITITGSMRCPIILQIPDSCAAKGHLSERAPKKNTEASYDHPCTLELQHHL